jgi:hypothetical protein
MDFIEKLPTSDGYDSILVVVDRLTKLAIFVPTTTSLSARGLADLFVRHVFSKHGVPVDIVSDRGTKFTSAFWSSLSAALGIKQNLSTAYHLQTDGQTERVNQVLEQYLHLYVNYDQDNWAALLPLAEFAYNNAPHSSTNMSPFFATYGYHPTLDIAPRLARAGSAAEHAENLRDLHEHAKKEIAKAIDRFRTAADRGRLPAPDYRVGQHVWLSAENIRTTRPSRKLAERRLGPFRIAEIVSKSAVRLDLPPHLRTIHPVFHVSLLEPVSSDDIPGRRQAPPPPVEAEGELEWEVESILASRLRRRKLYYLVQWSGFTDDNDRTSWEPAANLRNASVLVAEFHRLHPEQPGPSALRQSPRTGRPSEATHT